MSETDASNDTKIFKLTQQQMESLKELMDTKNQHLEAIITERHQYLKETVDRVEKTVTEFINYQKGFCLNRLKDCTEQNDIKSVWSSIRKLSNRVLKMEVLWSLFGVGLLLIAYAFKDALIAFLFRR